MPYIETRDHVSLYYRDWGTGAPIVFISSWSFGGAMWEYQMISLSEQGQRCIACDRRGHGRSDDPGRGYDFDTLADDLDALLTQLDLHEITLVGHSMGCAEIARYLSRYGTGRVALISPITPYLLATEDNPFGAPRAAHEAHATALANDRPLYFVDGAIKFFNLGVKWPEPPVLSNAMVEWATRLILECSPKATIEFRRALGRTDFRPDMRAFTVPTLIIHGDRDETAPLEICGRRTAQAIEGSQLKVYEGAPHGLFLTDRKRLNDDLLAWSRGEL